MYLAYRKKKPVDIGSHVISDTEQSAPQAMGNVFVVIEETGAISSQTCEQMKKAVGFRNVAVHNYVVINWKIVDAVCGQSVTGFRQFARESSQHASLSLTSCDCPAQ